MSWQQFESLGQGAPKEITFWRGPFQHPLFVVFSSGTTGSPKAIIHGAGNILLARKLVARIHLNLDHRDVCCQFTTMGWVMYALLLEE
jgi:acetoacetyl-CoA synthetase